MCRWLAYTGEPLQPAALILDAKHSVVAMSQNSNVPLRDVARAVLDLAEDE